MSTSQDGGPAFPRSGAVVDGMVAVTDQEGMTLRDYFAAKAMSGLLASGHFTMGEGGEGEGPWLVTEPGYDENGNRKGRCYSVIDAAFSVADAMLAERAKEAK